MTATTVEEQITLAISAHAKWKQRLVTAIKDGHADITVAVAGVDNRCPFGEWLYRDEAQLRGAPQYAEVRRIHADFHRCAAHVLELALEGRATDATVAMGPGSEFAKTSTALTLAMSNWKNAP
jgi:chemoreceptor zinc-binding protein